jgi:hypothetical protein
MNDYFFPRVYLSPWRIPIGLRTAPASDGYTDARIT